LDELDEFDCHSESTSPKPQATSPLATHRSGGITPRDRWIETLQKDGILSGASKEEAIALVQKLQAELDATLSDSEVNWFEHQDEIEDLVDMYTHQSELWQQEKETYIAEASNSKERIRALEGKLNNFAKSFSATPRGEITPRVLPELSLNLRAIITEENEETVEDEV